MKKVIIMAMFGLMSHTAMYSQQQEETKSGKGYMGMVDMFYGIGAGDYDGNQFGITMVNGYRFNPYFFLGAGLGVKVFPDLEMMYFPAFLELRANLMKTNIAPFVSVNLGFNMDESFGGLFFNPNMGVRFRIKDNFSLHLSLGYEMLGGIVIEKSLPYYANMRDPNSSYLAYESQLVSLNSFIVKLGASF